MPSVFANHTTAFTGDPCTAAPTPVEQLAIFINGHAGHGDVELAWIAMDIAQYKSATGRVVGHGILDLQFPVTDARINDFKARAYVIRCTDDIGGCYSRPDQIFFNTKASSASALGWIS